MPLPALPWKILRPPFLRVSSNLGISRAKLALVSIRRSSGCELIARAARVEAEEQRAERVRLVVEEHAEVDRPAEELVQQVEAAGRC